MEKFYYSKRGRSGERIHRLIRRKDFKLSKKRYLEFLYFIFITMMRFFFFIFVFVIHVRNLQNRGV